MRSFTSNRNSLSLLLLLLLCLTGCFQQDGNSNRSTVLHWIEDKSGAMEFDEVREKSLSTQWNRSETNILNFGFTSSAYWLNLTFENNKEVSASLLLEAAFPLHDSIDVYFMEGGDVVSTYRSGDQYPFSQRPLKHRNFLFPHTLEPKAKLRAIVRVQSSDTMYLPLKIWDSNEFFTRDQNEVMWLGICFGLLSIMLFYNLFLYLLTKNESYFYYVCYTAAIIYLQMTQKGLGYQYFWSDKAFFNQISATLTVYITILASSVFIWKFLGLNKKEHAKTILFFKSFSWLALIGIISNGVMIAVGKLIVPYQLMIISTATLGTIATVVVLVILIQLSMRGNDSARIISLAWAFLLTGSALFALGRLGVQIPMMLSENAMLVGSSIEAALISFALARYLKVEREARLYAQELALYNERRAREAQESLLLLREKATQQLEHQVQERTKKLEIAMQNLTIANHKLDNLSRIDSLTGLSNRRNFDQEFNEAWSICSESNQPISLLMADIDHFKSINDTYGHLFGDQCLIKVGEILSECVNQPEYLAARFGGEEFIIMLPGTNAREARIISERIREDIEQLRLSYQGKTVSFTISVGVSCITPTSDTSFVDLNEKADQALYAAKENGRNQVVVDDLSYESACATLDPLNRPRCLEM